MFESWIFWKKSPSGKNGQKWPKNMVFELFKKIMSLVLSGICVKSKFLWFINILQKLHAWEKSSSQVKDKNGSRPMRFQYSLIISISLIDQYLTLILAYRQTWIKETRLVKRFSEKILIWANGPFGAPKLHILIMLEEFFFNFGE